MSIDEPTAVGTVVRTQSGSLFVLAADDGREDRWMYMGGRCWMSWSSIATYNPVIVHEGYTPPTPEPLFHGARVVSAADLRLVRTCDGDAPDGCPWASPRGGRYAWSELSQPVTVIDDGSDW